MNYITYPRVTIPRPLFALWAIIYLPVAVAGQMPVAVALHTWQGQAMSQLQAKSAVGLDALLAAVKNIKNKAGAEQARKLLYKKDTQAGLDASTASLISGLYKACGALDDMWGEKDYKNPSVDVLYLWEIRPYVNNEVQKSIDTFIQKIEGSVDAYIWKLAANGRLSQDDWQKLAEAFKDRVRLAFAQPSDLQKSDSQLRDILLLDIARYRRYSNFIIQKYPFAQYTNAAIPQAGRLILFVEGRVVLAGLIAGSKFVQSLSDATLTSAVKNQLYIIQSPIGCDRQVSLLKAIPDKFAHKIPVLPNIINEVELLGKLLKKELKTEPKFAVIPSYIEMLKV